MNVSQVRLKNYKKIGNNIFFFGYSYLEKNIRDFFFQAVTRPQTTIQAVSVYEKFIICMYLAYMEYIVYEFFFLEILFYCQIKVTFLRVFVCFVLFVFF